MAKSNTQKRLDKVVDTSLKRVSDWTRRELTELRANSNTPICVELQNGNYMVATFTVEKINVSCWRVGTIDFADKRSAILYCALVYLNKHNDADEILEADRRVSTLEMDKMLFRLRVNKAHDEKDQFRIDLYSCRYEEVRLRLVSAKQELEKNIKKAKYLKLLGT